MNKDYTIFYTLVYKDKKYIYDPYGINSYAFSLGNWHEMASSGKSGKICDKNLQGILNTIQFGSPQLPDMFVMLSRASYEERRRLETMALTWLQLKVKGLKTNTNLEYVKTSRKFIEGKLYFYIYDAKWKNILPIWDAFPLTLVLGTYKNGFLGLNLHYLKVHDRIKLIRFLVDEFSLWAISKDPTISPRSEFYMNINWEMLKRLKFEELYKSCIKRYLFDHVKSRIVPLESHEWAYSIFLPAQDFRKNANARKSANNK